MNTSKLAHSSSGVKRFNKSRLIFIDSIKIRYLAVFLLVSYTGIKDETGVGVRRDRVAEVRPDQCAADDFSVAVGDIVFTVVRAA